MIRIRVRDPRASTDAWVGRRIESHPGLSRTGIPIGNLTSQFFANVLLDPLDHFIKEDLRVGRTLRYVDDFACFDDDKARLRELRARIRSFLLGLRLRLNERKSRIRRPAEGVEFLGFVVRPDSVRLNARGIRRMRRRMRVWRREALHGELNVEKMSDSFQAWASHAAHGDTSHLRSELRRSLPVG